MKLELITPKNLIVLIVLFLSGFLISYLVFKPSVKNKANLHVGSDIYVPPLLNPLLNEYQKRNFDLRELHNFRSKIENYISQRGKEIPGLHVSYYFRDLNQGLWIGINEKETFAPASLMKIPVMIAVLKKAQREPEILNLSVQYDSTSMGKVSEEAGVKKVHGRSYTLSELIEMMIEYSDNFATLALLDYIGEAEVQKVEHDLNIFIKQGYTEFTNFVTVKAYAGFLRILYNSSYLNWEMSEKALEYLAKSSYKEGLRRAIPDSIRVAHKYGKRDLETNGGLKTLQLHHFGLVYHPKKPFILGIMTRGSSLNVKEDIIYDLSKITYDELNRQLAVNPDNSVFIE
jgi:beta-lactamase class A